MRSLVEYWTDIINSMTLDELREINKQKNHFIWYHAKFSNELWPIFSARFEHFGTSVNKYEAERRASIEEQAKLKVE
jgi:hypothetical protein